MTALIQKHANVLSHNLGNSETKVTHLTWPTLRALEAKNEEPQLPAFCVPCGADLRSRTHYQNHLTGARHRGEEVKELNSLVARSPLEHRRTPTAPARHPPATLGGARSGPSPTSTRHTFASPHSARRLSVPAGRIGKFHVCVCDASFFVPKA